MALSAINTIGHLPATSRGHQWALIAIFIHTSYVFAILIKDMSAENVVEAYLSNVFAHNIPKLVLNMCIVYRISGQYNK